MNHNHLNSNVKIIDNLTYEEYFMGVGYTSLRQINETEWEVSVEEYEDAKGNYEANRYNYHDDDDNYIE
jgi:hypothetical protein